MRVTTNPGLGFSVITRNGISRSYGVPQSWLAQEMRNLVLAGQIEEILFSFCGGSLRFKKKEIILALPIGRNTLSYETGRELASKMGGGSVWAGSLGTISVEETGWGVRMQAAFPGDCYSWLINEKERDVLRALLGGDID